MVDKQNRLDEPDDDLADLEEPTIDGPEPRTARDFVKGSWSGYGTRDTDALRTSRH
ncbi:hypothetical protein [Nocardia otitidiscaviarum]|uniref:hypothetical protein n=1 Tax=Nocardia otitidiscaviarum TaxID=1823 RepID=UPI0024576A32|nr:hypothetical protein [Nocardia otitidiscaviarum]